MRKILKVYNNPIIKTYPYIGTYLGILECNQFETKKILYKYYLSLYYFPITGQINFLNRFHIKNLFEKKKLNFEKENLISKIKEKISNGEYVTINLEGKYFSDYPDGFVHDWIIYGFDDELENFYAIGYICEKGNLIYKTFPISYDAFIQAIPKRNTYKKSNPMYNHIFYLDDKFQLEDVSAKDICISVKNYIKSRNLIFFNYNVYKNLLYHIKLYYLFNLKPYKRDLLDLRDIRILVEHTYLIREALIYLNVKDEYIEQYNYVYKKIKQVMNLVMKYKFSNEKEQKRIIKRICSNIDWINKNERKIIEFAINNRMDVF